MRELNSLKQQMAALQQMMRLQMDMQADVQRSIRQEISAAMNSTLGTESSGDCNNGKKNCERTLWNNQHMTIIRSICKPKINEIFFSISVIASSTQVSASDGLCVICLGEI